MESEGSLGKKAQQIDTPIYTHILTHFDGLCFFSEFAVSVNEPLCMMKIRHKLWRTELLRARVDLGDNGACCE